MPTREEKIAFLQDRQKKIDFLKQKQGGGESRYPGQDFVESFTQGSDIGENIPGGRALANVGTSIGAGIAAAGKYPFSDKGYGELYDESIAPSLAIRERERAADEASPVGSFVKSTLAGVPIGAMKAAGPVASAAAPVAETAVMAETGAVPLASQAASQVAKQAAKAEPAAMRTVQKMDPFTKKMTTVTEPVVPPAPRTSIDPFTKKPIVSEAPAQAAMKEATETIAPEAFEMGTGNFSYPADTMKEKIADYFARKNMPKGESGSMGKIGKFLLQEGEEMLPYTARKGLQIARKVKRMRD